MDSRTVTNRLARISLTLGISGWITYLLQWCFDLTLGLLLATVTAGLSAICATVLDFLPFVLWLLGIVTGHVALGQIKQAGILGRRQAISGLVLSYVGMIFSVLLIVIIFSLIAAGIGVGVHDKIFPVFPGH
jgi:hypothetical protein